MKHFRLLLLLVIAVLSSCNEKGPPAVIEILDGDRTGIDFSNNLTPTLDLNVFNYMYFYNGGGVGTGDLNNDGLVDVVFTSNQERNKIYLNKGDFQFQDVSQISGFISDNGWSNGVAISDVNQDGLLDIYISQVGKLHNIEAHNLLYICSGISDDGVPTYKESSQEYGLDLQGFGTQAAFFDFDLDGDLDLFQLNHSLHQNGTFGRRENFEDQYHELAGDRLFRNDQGKFVDVTKECGIRSSVIGYGLGLAVGDINNDHYPDIYIGNDFHENDYLYINNGDGTFSDKITDYMMHTSRFTMGVDIADINNDLHADIIGLDMLPYDPVILKKSEGEDALDIFKFKLGYGYNHQYAKNALQLNNGNGSFSEIAMLSGVHATDWSWSPLMVDINNNGLKDLFVTNGIPRRMNDIDYINFMSKDDVQFRVQFDNMVEEDLELVNAIPQIKLPNKVFMNEGNLTFRDIKASIGNNLTSYSNGLAMADFDNDGDLDFVTNNIDEKAFIYKNNSETQGNNFLKVKLFGDEGNRNGIGARLFVYSGDSIQSVENFVTRGFQSSSHIPIHIGLGKKRIDSLVVVWPGGNYQVESDVTINANIDLKKNINRNGEFQHPSLKKYFSMNSVGNQLGVRFEHKENPFEEFNREPLVPHATSGEGPGLAVGDFNNDGKQDFYVGSSKRQKAAIFLQNEKGFSKIKPEIFYTDSIHEEVVAIAEDLNGDGFDDLILGNGGNEYYYEDTAAMSRIYLNDQKGSFTKIYIPGVYSNISDLVLLETDQSDVKHLFMSGRSVSWGYGEIPKSYILEINKSLELKDVTNEVCAPFYNLGMIKGMEKVDLDKDGDEDIIAVLEWGGIKLLENVEGNMVVSDLYSKHGWWNFSYTYDFDGDGDNDILVGNLGWNSRLKASENEPVSMYYSDFDGNDRKEQIITYYVEGKEIPFANMMEIGKQIPSIKKKFLYAKDFSTANLEDIFGAEKLAESINYKVEQFENGFLENKDGKFVFRPMSPDLQTTSYTNAEILDYNGDGLPDIFILGNFYHNNIQMGRLDADYGSLLINSGNFEFERLLPKNNLLKGPVNSLASIGFKKEMLYLIGKNNDKLEIVNME